MASPFPGMDPYLERSWGDVHHMLIAYARDQLRTLLPRDLRARVEERVLVESPGDGSRGIIPDLRILERHKAKRTARLAAAGAAAAEPLIVHFDDAVTEGYIQIIDVSSGHRVVTVIEVLSPTNKLSGAGQDKYLQKRQELRDARINLVEIDLSRTGKRLLPVPWHKVTEPYRTTYNAWVWRSSKPTCVEIYGMPLRMRLPAIRIPLREADADVSLDLQALVEACYRNGDYEDDLNYQEDPDPPLDPADALWADALLRKAGRRVPSRSRRPHRHNGRRKKS